MYVCVCLCLLFVSVYVCLSIGVYIGTKSAIIIIITCRAKNFDQSSVAEAWYGSIAIYHRLGESRGKFSQFYILLFIIAIFSFYNIILLNAIWYAGRFSYSRIRITYGPNRSLPGKKKSSTTPYSIFPRPRHGERPRSGR